MLNYQRNSLAYLLKKFCDLDVDKSFQAADWRIRYGGEEMRRNGEEEQRNLDIEEERNSDRERRKRRGKCKRGTKIEKTLRERSKREKHIKDVASAGEG